LYNSCFTPYQSHHLAVFYFSTKGMLLFMQPATTSASATVLSPEALFLSKAQNKTLEDVQGKVDTRNVPLEAAGVSQVEMPLQVLQKNGKTQTVAATVSMSVALPPEEKGTHMSRFIIQLASWSSEKALSFSAMKAFLEELNQRLNSKTAQVEICFKYFIDKKAPVTDGSAPMAYNVRLRGALAGQTLTLFVRLEAAMATLCPCSKSISDFGAHNQRAITTLDLLLDDTQLNTAEASPLWIEDLIALVDEQASCPVFPLLKRADEKWVTERQYTNAKFVEDVVRDASLALREVPAVKGFAVKCEALESIHGHNAWAAHQEGYPVYFF
jgi:GTP cyclohydrolase IB